MGSVLTIEGVYSALKAGGAALDANHYEGAIYHLMSRGDRRQEIFRDDVRFQRVVKDLLRSDSV
jgi:hypothetical protein